MPIDFPSSPSVGQQYTYNGITYKFTAQGTWVNATGVGSFQPFDVDLNAIASLTSAADQLPYFTGAGSAGLTPLTAAARALLDDTDAAAMRATIGAAPLIDPNLLPVTFDPYRSSSYNSLSNGNLTATKLSNDANWGASYTRPPAHVAVAQFVYCEATVTNKPTSDDLFAIGVSNHNAGTDGTYPGADVNGVSLYSTGMIYYNAGGYAGTGITYTTGHVLAMAVNLANGFVWFRNITTNSLWNGSWTAATEATVNAGVAGSAGFLTNYFPAFAGASYVKINQASTYNFDGPFLGPVPARYRRWRGGAIP